MRALALILLALTLTGCATTATAPRTDTVSFDRAAFAFTYADWSARLKADCAKAPQDVICNKLDIMDAQIRQAVIDAPKNAVAPPADPLSTLLPLLMKLAPLAGGL